MVIKAGRGVCVAEMTDAERDEMWNAIEDATGDEGERCERIAKLVDDDDPTVLQSAEAFLSAFATAYRGVYGRPYAFGPDA